MRYDRKPSLSEQLLVAAPALAGVVLVLALVLRFILGG